MMHTFNGNAATSPTAKIPGTAVRKRLSTYKKMRILVQLLCLKQKKLGCLRNFCGRAQRLCNH